MQRTFGLALFLCVAACGARGELLEEGASSTGGASSVGGATSVSTTEASTTSLVASSSSASIAVATSTSTGVPPTGCTASNYLSHDSFDVVANALDLCFNSGKGCKQDSTSVFLPNLDEGNGDVTFVYSTAVDGTHSLVGHGNPDAAPAPPGIILQADGIPASATLGDALSVVYLEGSSFTCTWD